MHLDKAGKYCVCFSTVYILHKASRKRILKVNFFFFFEKRWKTWEYIYFLYSGLSKAENHIFFLSVNFSGILSCCVFFSLALFDFNKRVGVHFFVYWVYIMLFYDNRLLLYSQVESSSSSSSSSQSCLE